LHNKLIARVKDKLNDAKNFSDFVVEAIVLLKEEAHTLHGPDKKEMAIDLVKSVVENMEISDEDKAELKAKVFPTLGNTVDVLIAAAKGYLFLQKVEDAVCAKCTAKCGGGKCSGCKKADTNAKSFRSGEATLESPQTAEGVVDVTALSNTVYDELRAMITHKQVTPEGIIGIATLAMQLVQQFAGVSGADKKKIVINVVTKLIDEIPMGDGPKAALKMVLNTTLDKTIDLIIGVASGEIDLIGTVKDGVAQCKTMCGC
jgi:hypothetical protein